MATKTKVEVVTDIDRCTKIVEQLEKLQVIALDAEGVNLGKEGPLTLLQIGTPDGEVYIFDVYKNKHLFQAGKLKDILQSNKIVKVIHSCSGDSAALHFQFEVTLQKVFDTQVAHLVIEEHKGRKLPSPAKLADICNMYSKTAQVSDHKDTLKEIWTTSDGELWAKRPLTEEMIQYASGDVTALIPEVYETQKMYLESNALFAEFKSRVIEEIKYDIDPAIFARKHERLDSIANRIVSEFDKKYRPDIEFGSITDEDDIKALNNVRFDNPSLSPLVKRLKTDAIKVRLKTLRDQLSEEGDNFMPKCRSFGFLIAYQYLPDVSIKEEAKQLKQIVDRVVLKGITKKYKPDARLSMITRYEKESLKSIRPSREHGQPFDPVVLALYWQIQEEDLDETIEKFRIDPKTYSISQGKYKWLKYVRSGDVPQRMKEKAKQHIQDLDKMFGKGQCPFSK